MSRAQGGVTFGNNFEPEIGAPLDARNVVEFKADLTLAATWTTANGIYVYDGMTVTVWDDPTAADNGTYILQDAANYTLPVSWLFVGAGGGTVTYTNLNLTPIDFPTSGTTLIPAGESFNAQTVKEMFDKILYPELFPVLVDPSLAPPFALTVDGVTPSSNFQEIGVTVRLDFTANFDQGTITPAYTTNGLRSGLPNSYDYTGTDLPLAFPSTSLSDTKTVATYEILGPIGTPNGIPGGIQSWTCLVDYDAGPQPLSSTGNPYLSPLPADSTAADTVSIIGVYPTFATTVSIGTKTQQPLQLMSTFIEVAMVAETGSSKQTLDVPVAWSTITGLQQYNTLSQTWDTINLATFQPATSITKTIQGLSVNYNRYTHNGSTVGARQLRFLI